MKIIGSDGTNVSSVKTSGTHTTRAGKTPWVPPDGLRTEILNRVPGMCES